MHLSAYSQPKNKPNHESAPLDYPVIVRRLHRCFGVDLLCRNPSARQSGIRRPATCRNARRPRCLRSAQACQSMQYEYFARIAHAERQEQAARLFRAMALSERVHEGICADAIVRLGGHYEPPVRVVVFRGTTDGNLNRSIDYERQSLCTRCGKDIHRALSAGNRYAAQILARADARRHAARHSDGTQPQFALPARHRTHLCGLPRVRQPHRFGTRARFLSLLPDRTGPLRPVLLMILGAPTSTNARGRFPVVGKRPRFQSKVSGKTTCGCKPPYNHLHRRASTYCLKSSPYIHRPNHT